MLRRSMAAGLVLFVLSGFVLAETYQGMITKIEDNKVTFRTRGKEKGEKGKEYTFKITRDTKIEKAGAKDSDPKAVSSRDLKTAITVVGAVRAKIETKGEGDDETATSITLGGRAGSRPKKGKKNDE